MYGIVLTLPILPGKVENWRRFCQELSSSRLQMYLSSRRRLGITHERLALIETTFRATAVINLEAFDATQLLSQISTSRLSFDVWYRERLQEMHGINLVAYEQFLQPKPLLQNEEVLFEWTLTSSVDG